MKEKSVTEYPAGNKPTLHTLQSPDLPRKSLILSDPAADFLKPLILFQFEHYDKIQGGKCRLAG